MARKKQTIWQNDFGFGAVRPEVVERDDTELVASSLKVALNTVSLTTGQCEVRPGTVYESTTDSRAAFEVNLGNGQIYDAHITEFGFVIYNDVGTVVAGTTTFDWTTLPNKYGTYTFDQIKFWSVSDPDSSSVIIGSQYFPMQAITFADDGSWTVGEVQIDIGISGAVSYPYYRYERNITIQPSARFGSITITASAALWTAEHDGMFIRYGDRAIQLGTLVSSTVINATVVERLPPTYEITVASSENFTVGDAVEEDTIGGQGIVVSITGNVLTVFATSTYDGFGTDDRKLIGPNSSQSITAVVEVSPADIFLWDEQMFSPVRGYAGHGTRHQGRVYLCDFPNARRAFAASAAGSVTDFLNGPNDGDGFVEVVGTDRGGELLYMISSEDLLFFTTRGVFYQQSRDGSIISPTTIRPVIFSQIGCAAVTPVAVDDGAIFIDAVGEQVYGAVMVGDVYRSWRANLLTKFHPHLITAPVALGATVSGSERPEQFIFVINADGDTSNTIAVCQWDREDNRVSWRPWSSNGRVKSMYQSINRVRWVIDRGTLGIFREKFEYGVYVDSATVYSPQKALVSGFGSGMLAEHLNGERVPAYMGGWDFGDRLITNGRAMAEDGSVFPFPTDDPSDVQIGLQFDVEIEPWSRRSVETQRGTREIKRLIEMFVTVQHTGPISIGGEKFGGYRVSEDLSSPPPLRDEQYRLGVLGGDDYEAVPIRLSRPGPLRLMKIGYRVVV